MIKLIHFFVAAGKKAGAFHIGINGNGSKAVGVDGFKGIFFEADISVSLKRERGLENVVAAGKNIFDPVSCGAHIFRIEVAVVIENLCVRKHYSVSAVAADAHFNVARHILSEVNDALALRRDYHLHRRDSFLLADKFSRLRKELCFDGFIDGGFAERYYIGCHIDGLAVIYFGIYDMRGMHAPRAVRAEALL